MVRSGWFYGMYLHKIRAKRARGRFIGVAFRRMCALLPPERWKSFKFAFKRLFIRGKGRLSFVIQLSASYGRSWRQTITHDNVLRLKLKMNR